jgi:hypothetical protein
MLVTPYWFGQRQLKAESVGDNVYRITGPNAPEWILGIRQAENGRYQAFLRRTRDGSDEAVTEAAFSTAYDAWEAAFELYRSRVVV